MLNTHFTDIVKMADTMRTRKLAALLGLLCRFNVFVRNKVIQHDRYAILIKYTVKAGFFELVDRHRRGNVVAENNIQLRIDQLPRGYGFQPRVCRQYFLCHGHSHV